MPTADAIAYPPPGRVDAVAHTGCIGRHAWRADLPFLQNQKKCEGKKKLTAAGALGLGHHHTHCISLRDLRDLSPPHPIRSRSRMHAMRHQDLHLAVVQAEIGGRQEGGHLLEESHAHPPNSHAHRRRTHAVHRRDPAARARRPLGGEEWGEGTEKTRAPISLRGQRGAPALFLTCSIPSHPTMHRPRPAPRGPGTSEMGEEGRTEKREKGGGASRQGRGKLGGPPASLAHPLSPTLTLFPPPHPPTSAAPPPPPPPPPPSPSGSATALTCTAWRRGPT